MANPIKYSTGSESLALKKGNFYIGTGDVGKGPTSTTGYYNGITPPSGGYTIYLNKATGGPSIYVCNNDEELTGLTNTISGQAYTTPEECLGYFATQSDKLCINRDYEPILTDGLILNYDAGFTPSYPKSGSTIYDLTNSQSGSLYNAPTFDTNEDGTISFDGTNDYMDLNFNYSIYNGGSSQPFSMEVWLKHPPYTLQSGEIFAGAYGSSRFIGAMIGYAYRSGTTQIRFNSMYGGVGGQELTNYIEQDNGWHQFVMTFEPPNSAKNYVDGVLKSTRSITPNSSAYFNNIRIAKNRGFACMELIFSSLRAYNITLSQENILSNYLSTLKKYTNDNCVTNGLLLYLESSYKSSYKGSGTSWKDISGNNKSGTLLNGATYSQNNNGVIVLDGTDDYINGTFSHTFTNGWTVEIWVYIDSRPSYPDDEGIWRISSSGTRRLNLRRTNTSSNSWRYEVTGPNGQTGTSGMQFNATTDGTWSQLICTYDGNTTLRAYHNSTLKKTGTFNIGEVPVSSFQIGENSSSPHLDGSVATYRVYNRELSSSEILQNYNAQKDRFGL